MAESGSNKIARANIEVTVVGAGLAGCEAAWALVQENFRVRLCEMKPEKRSPAHQIGGYAELVCSNSLKADRLSSAGGLLKAEMRRMGSLLLQIAERCKVPAGGALAVDRQEFSRLSTAAINENPGITVINGEVTKLPEGPVIIATGPLTSDALARDIESRFGAGLRFYDAAAPIITADSLDRDKVFSASRYDRGGDDYINCPLTKDEYERFYDALTAAQCAGQESFEEGAPKVYEGCMPIEMLAKRGIDTLRFGPLKPMGLRDPRTGHRPWAAVQLRKENAAGSLLNLVGFQTNLKFGEQKRVFSMIPGLENASFVRYGVMHRNTFIDSPRLLDHTFALKADPLTAFAGQITGVEGYMESAMSGIIAAKNLARLLKGQAPVILPPQTMTGALCAYISDESVKDFQPMGANMGLLPPLSERIKPKAQRYEAMADRALRALEEVMQLSYIT
ncbi:MAG: methylenetetrahydrofolate--tRNA-(uracil(54)-C(5))-methyltransferase (FADH(2)-oxidizing) TrmFO [Oscillospiraceae bacterium]|nr:methylenetetrahydrofolate--tRNA-(uracil(54)-C(5))-methyltransferase (FADH(2)-oxidizing) TrmFO [Oscillospiraceae bacterium]